MPKELAVHRGGALKKVAAKGALKKAAKKSALRKAPGKKAAGKKAPGKKSAKQGSESSLPRAEGQSRAFHHLNRAVALISLLEQESGSDVRMLLEEGIGAYRRSAWAPAIGLLQAAEHLGMAGLYAARADHRIDVEEPDPAEIERRLDTVAVRLDGLEEFAGNGAQGRIHAMAAELIHRAEAADHDLHLAWELLEAAAALCDGLNGTRV